MSLAPKNKFIKALILIVSIGVYAGPPGGGPPPPTPPPPPGLPIDSGIVILFVIAVFFGTYVVRRKRIKIYN